MKTIIITIIYILTFLVVNSQEVVTDEEYEILSRILDNGSDLHYDSPISGKSLPILLSSDPFTRSRVLTIERDHSNQTMITKVLIIVNSTAYNQVRGRIERYCYDIHMVFGSKIIMERVSGGNHTNVKNLIVSETDGLCGVVFIGDIPTAWYEGYHHSDPSKFDTWPCDLYYTDLDGVWSDSNGNGILDSHTGNVQPEIFLGRISTSNMGSLISERVGLERYFDKNHRYWLGHLPINQKYGLTYTDEDWRRFSYFLNDISFLYGSSNYDSFTELNPQFGKPDYLQRLSNDRYEFVQIAAHSSPIRHRLTVDDTKHYIYGNEIFNINPKAIGYNLFACKATRWTDANSSNGFLGGAYVYSNSSSALVAVGSTKSGSMLGFRHFYQPLGEGKPIGLSLKEWWNNFLGSSFSDREVWWHYGMTIIGDPLVDLFHCMNDKCVNNITLNIFNNNNQSNVHYYLAKNSILISNSNNYVIPAGKHVVFNAKSITIEGGFECKLGASLDIYSIGCENNCE